MNMITRTAYKDNSNKYSYIDLPLHIMGQVI
jgi:hypothetical protein